MSWSALFLSYYSNFLFNAFSFYHYVPLQIIYQHLSDQLHYKDSASHNDMWECDANSFSRSHAHKCFYFSLSVSPAQHALLEDLQSFGPHGSSSRFGLGVFVALWHLHLSVLHSARTDSKTLTRLIGENKHTSASRPATRLNPKPRLSVERSKRRIANFYDAAAGGYCELTRLLSEKAVRMFYRFLFSGKIKLFEGSHLWGNQSYGRCFFWLLARLRFSVIFPSSHFSASLDTTAADVLRF